MNKNILWGLAIVLAPFAYGQLESTSSDTGNGSTGASSVADAPIAGPETVPATPAPEFAAPSSPAPNPPVSQTGVEAGLSPVAPPPDYRAFEPVRQVFEIPIESPGEISAKTQATGSLDSVNTVLALRTTLQPERKNVLAAIDSNIEAGSRAIAALNPVSGVVADDKVRTSFPTAMEDVAAKENKVRSSLAAARRANIDAWHEARIELADDYLAYAEAVARADAIAHPAPPPIAAIPAPEPALTPTGR